MEVPNEVPKKKEVAKRGVSGQLAKRLEQARRQIKEGKSRSFNSLKDLRKVVTALQK